MKEKGTIKVKRVDTDSEYATIQAVHTLGLGLKTSGLALV